MSATNELKRLVLTIKDGGKIQIGEALLSFRREGGRWRVLVEAPEQVKIYRDEVLKKMEAE